MVWVSTYPSCISHVCCRTKVIDWERRWEKRYSRWYDPLANGTVVWGRRRLKIDGIGTGFRNGLEKRIHLEDNPKVNLRPEHHDFAGVNRNERIWLYSVQYSWTTNGDSLRTQQDRLEGKPETRMKLEPSLNLPDLGLIRPHWGYTTEHKMSPLRVNTPSLIVSGWRLVPSISKRYEIRNLIHDPKLILSWPMGQWIPRDKPADFR